MRKKIRSILSQMRLFAFIFICLSCSENEDATDSESGNTSEEELSGEDTNAVDELDTLNELSETTEGASSDEKEGDAFELVDSVELPGTSRWGVLSNDGEYVYVTVASGSEISLQIYTTDLEQVGNAVALTEASDHPTGNIADHKSLQHDGALYICAHITGDTDLYLFKTDLDGIRLKDFVTVAENSEVNTNDPHCGFDGTHIFVIYGQSGTDRTVHLFDTALNEVDAFTLTTTDRYGQLGGTFFYDGRYYMFTGNESQNNLIVTQWDENWNEVDPLRTTLIQGNGTQFNYFASGVLYNASSNRWYIGYMQLNDVDTNNVGGTRDQDEVFLAAFDGEFNLLQNYQVAGVENFRPHLTLFDGNLYLAHDGDGVSLYKFSVE